MRVTATAVRRLVHALDTSGHFAIPTGELSIAILDAQAMGALHAEYLADPSPTDVITFEGDPSLNSAGEICVCAEIACEYAREHRYDFARELALYIAHGYLHLAGFDDTSTSKRQRMRRAEKQAMAVLAEARAIPAAKLAPLDSPKRRLAR